MGARETNYDIVIIGGGIIGSSIAYWLAANSNFDGSIAVIEKDLTYQNSSTARSNSCIRQQFSTPENILISGFGIEFIKNVGAYLSVDGEAPELTFVEDGYLFLANKGNEPALKKTLEILDAHNVSDVIWQSVAQLQERYPWMNTDGLVGATLGVHNEGWFDPFSLLQGFKRKARSLGVTYIEDEVVGLTKDSGRITEVITKNSGAISCGGVVNAAGPYARFIADMAGLDIPVSPRKRSVFVFDCREDVPMEPLVIGTDGMYVRKEGKFFICGQQPDEDKDPECLDLDVEHEFFEERLWPALAKLVPAFEAIKPINAWAGHYAMNLADQNALLGTPAGMDNFYLACGFSGHGLQQSPAIGRAVSELIIYGEYRTLDLSRFAAARLTTCDYIRELYVV